MIARRVPTRGRSAGKAGSGFGRLANYVTTDKAGKSGAPGDRTAEGIASGAEALGSYVMDQARHDGRVRWTRITNCGAVPGESARDPHPDDIAIAIREIGDTQRGNRRVRSDPNYHLVISFPPGERPTRAQIEDIEDELTGAIGLADHQRISALHDDKAHLHLHVAINRVHPTTGKLASTSHDRPKLQAAAARLEIKHGLTPTNHGTSSVRDADRAATAQSGRQSFGDWINERARDELMVASNAGEGWQGLHRAAGRYGLEIKPRGAGLVIVNQPRQGERVTAIRASTIDRALSFKALTDKLGTYEPPSGEPIAVIERYGREAQRPGRGALWQEYKSGQDATRAARDAALSARRAVEERYRAELKAHYVEAFGGLKTQRITEGIDPKLRAEALKRERAELWERFKQENAKARAAIYERHPATGWKEWLTARAEGGDKQAVGFLQKMDRRAETVRADIEANPGQAAGIALMASRKPTVGKNGSIYYRVDDGGLVIETAKGVILSEPSPAGAVIALDIARKKFGGQPLTVGERPEVRAALIEAAALPGVDVRFADPAMEAARATLVREKRIEAGRVGRPAGLDWEISRWIDEQNGEGRDGDFYRDRRPDDSGKASLAGIYQMGRARAALWRQGRTILVEQLPDAGSHPAYGLRNGDIADLATMVAGKPNKGGEQERGRDAGRDAEIDYEN